MAKPEDGFVGIVDNNEIAKNDFNLSPSRYLINGTTDIFRGVAAIVKDLKSIEDEAEMINRELKKVLVQLV
jgi:type I restriction enzyme M protein